MKSLYRTVTGLMALSALSFSLAVPVFADDDGKAPSRLEKRRASVMEKYEFTGESKTCVPLHHLRSSSVLDDKTIFFRANSKVGYMVELNHRCPRLAYEERFAYKTSIGSLCSHDIITVIDSFGRDWASCGLGEFKVMKRRDDKADDDEGGDNPAE